MFSRFLYSNWGRKQCNSLPRGQSISDDEHVVDEEEEKEEKEETNLRRKEKNNCKRVKVFTLIVPR